MNTYLYDCCICGKEFSTYNSSKNVCSIECRKIANRLYAKEFMRNKRKRENEVVVKTCLDCGISFNTLKINNMTRCIPCSGKQAQQPVKQYDKTFKDSEGIIYGTIERLK